MVVQAAMLCVVCILYIHIIIFFLGLQSFSVCRMAQALALTMAFQCWCRPTAKQGTQTLGRRRARDRDRDRDYGQYMTSVADRVRKGANLGEGSRLPRDVPRPEGQAGLGLTMHAPRRGMIKDR